jgi:hypothetical protein
MRAGTTHLLIDGKFRIVPIWRYEALADLDGLAGMGHDRIPQVTPSSA